MSRNEDILQAMKDGTPMPEGVPQSRNEALMLGVGERINQLNNDLGDYSGGKKQRYVTQIEYDALSADEKASTLIAWNIIDATEDETLITEAGAKSEIYLKDSDDTVYKITVSTSGTLVVEEVNNNTVYVEQGTINADGTFADSPIKLRTTSFINVEGATTILTDQHCVARGYTSSDVCVGTVGVSTLATIKAISPTNFTKVKLIFAQEDGSTPILPADVVGKTVTIKNGDTILATYILSA